MTIDRTKASNMGFYRLWPIRRLSLIDTNVLTRTKMVRSTSSNTHLALLHSIQSRINLHVHRHAYSPTIEIRVWCAFGRKLLIIVGETEKSDIQSWPKQLSMHWSIWKVVWWCGDVQCHKGWWHMWGSLWRSLRDVLCAPRKQWKKDKSGLEGKHVIIIR